MAQLLALEWDGFEARVAVAQRHGSDVMIEHSFAVSLLPREPGQTFADVNIGQRVAAALGARRIGRVETLVAVGRASIELRLLSLPAAPHEELPQMVRFQAMRQFAALGDDWPLDFVPVETSDDGSQSVLAAAISNELVSQIRATCGEAELQPRRLILRPLAAASLLRRRDAGGGHRVRLMVDLLTDEADLTVLVDRMVVLIRTVRLPGGPNSPEQSSELLGEIRRTMAAAQNQLGGQRVQRVVLCGNGKEHAELKTQIEEGLSLTVELFDPFAGLRLSGELRSHPPDLPGRFAPLLGMLLDEASGAGHAIDFLHPRRKPKAQSRAPALSLAAGVVALICLIVAAVFGYQFVSLALQEASLTGQMQSLQTPEKAAKETQRDLAELEKWTAGDCIWLDELREMSDEFPPPEDAIVVQMRMASREQGGGGAIAFEGHVRDSTVIDDMEESLRDERHGVGAGNREKNDSREGYQWRINETVIISPPRQEGR